MMSFPAGAASTRDKSRQLNIPHPSSTMVPPENNDDETPEASCTRIQSNKLARAQIAEVAGRDPRTLRLEHSLTDQYGFTNASYDDLADRLREQFAQYNVSHFTNQELRDHGATVEDVTDFIWGKIPDANKA